MKNFLISLLDWIYKKKCYFCNSSNESIKMCSDCYNELEHSIIEQDRVFNNVKIYSAGLYEGNIQKLIRGIKYHNQRDLAFYQADFMFRYWSKIPDNTKTYIVVPVPLFVERERKRKYNHMTLVAEEFCKLSGYEINSKLIRRIKDTKPQYKLNKQQRMENLKNAFVIDKTVYNNQTVLLIDDICTTGSTFENIITELQKNNINDIVCLATSKPLVSV